MAEKLTVSFLMLTLDRYELSKSAFENNITNASHGLRSGVRFQYLVADNGSKDQRVVEHFAKLLKGADDYHRVNTKNEGCGRAFNQLFLRSTGDIIVLLGNDIINSPGWLEECLKYLYGVPNSGLVGIDWGHGGIPALTTRWGIRAHWLTPQLNRVFGTWTLRRRVIEEIGFFYEGYDVYGLEDSDVNERINLAGFNSLYVPNDYIRSVHMESDVGTNTPYRKMKDKAMANNLAIFHDRAAHFATRGIRDQLPDMRDPL